MAEDRDIKVTAWPAEPLRQTHRFDDHSPLPVRVGFPGPTPLTVRLGSTGSPIPVNMRMLLAARGMIPLCFSLCDAICADSDYSVGITLFGRPVITISLRGRTRIFSEV
jgi:hypothetical protein